MKIGLISNRRSQRNKRGFEVPSGPLAGGVELFHRPLDGVHGLAEIVADLAMAGVEVVAVNGGDGTVSAVLTELFEGGHFGRLPGVALLPGGTTNMCAADVGVRGAGGKALGRLLRRLAEGDLSACTVEREIIRVRQGEDRRPICGMFFGTAAITRAIETCHALIHPLKIKSSAAAGATLAFLLLRRLIWRNGGDSVIHGDEMTVKFDDGPAQNVNQLLALVTTLDRLVMRSRPFWGAETGALHYTGISYPPRRLFRSAYRVLYGGPKRKLSAPHYVSHNADRITFQMNCPFTLDGELFQPPPNTPVELSSAGRVRFLRC